VIQPPDLTRLSHAEKDALILALLARLAAADERIAAQEARIATLEAVSSRSRPPARPDHHDGSDRHGRS
jgi:hypothetical protein